MVEMARWGKLRPKEQKCLVLWLVAVMPYSGILTRETLYPLEEAASLHREEFRDKARGQEVRL